MNQRYTTEGMEKFLACYPDGPDCELSRIWHEEVSKRAEQYQALMESCNGNPEGIELKHHERDTWAAITPEMSNPEIGTHRCQYFDQSGFFSHYVWKSAEKTLEELLREGYCLPAPGQLDRLSVTTEWQIGSAKTDLIRQLNSRQITFEQYQSKVEQVSLLAA
ncbi:hypothetical protein QU487_06295 [Crenobacter sp. SG2305]|uniref:hypothetical protein n=1 Tax=Crenobacter oryzisoli TaxID=3056844 RepID=UPI0025AB0766|nr:hypothetical protein [Crenobacter sp. SG2305]MDN0082362.1 hypothetical protein [Crenobacter sp. SG2305]